MRIAFVLAVLVGCLIPHDVSAQATAESTLWLMHPVLLEGEQQTLIVVARDLSGSPMHGASITARIAYGSRVVGYQLQRTDEVGRTSLTFRPPTQIQAHAATVAVEISNGFLHVGLTGGFRLGSAPLAASVSALKIAARVLPNVVIAPAPAYVVLASHTAKGIVTPRIRVWATAKFKEGVLQLHGVADSAGVATLRVDTSKVSIDQTVKITAGATWGTMKGTSESTLKVRVPAHSAGAPSQTPVLAPSPLSTPTSTPTTVPTASPTMTPTPVPAPTEPALVPPTPVPAAPTGTPTSTPTPTAAPTWTPVPTWTPTATPTSTVLPKVVDTATATPVPQVVLATSTPTPTAQCPGTQQACVQAMLSIINTTRTQHNLAPYSLDETESNCAYAHSVHMQQAGFISHDQFPKPDLCIGYSSGGENVGTFRSGNELQDLQSMHNQMMSEGYTPGCIGSHACNILSNIYTVVGIGIYHAPDGGTWLTEDFVKP